MKRLIYTVALGAPVYLQMALESLRSARRQGYAGDALILSDQEPRIEGIACRKIEVGDDLLAKASLIRALSPAEIAAYDQVLFIDADCVFRAPIAEIFAHEDLRVATQGIVRIDRNDAYNLVFMTPEEQEEFTRDDHLQINSGMILMPGPEAFAFLRDWEDFWRSCPRGELKTLERWRTIPVTLMDQPALQALLWRTGRSKATFPHATMGFPLFGGDADSPVLHFCGQARPGFSRAQSKLALLGRMRAASRGARRA